MKQVFSSIAAIAFSAISCTFISVKSAEALEEGLYWGGGSRYIRIAKQEASSDRQERICYHGFSPNGSTITSLKLAIPRYETGIDYEVYLLESSKKSDRQNLAILQYGFSPNKITFGKLVKRSVREGLVYVRDGVAATDTTPELQECLNSNQPYFKQITSGRDRR
ncbi:hypothetical protein H6F42_18940 [Pseudanabaena sp. FACHB-1998]|uniref:hypothetical protein n=1 Tax=Pseudanabaena sp. FACHB-1998 TaxID=2692858 RepID=UPI00168180DD|nr:hypothetical protein [Pseudanabaena sp. FACHB-1998]MBD2179003.1 hypothetical protein [Pseudanabaena sp. FACHB-1998]